MEKGRGRSDDWATGPSGYERPDQTGSGDRRRRPVVVFGRIVLEGQALVELGERDRKADLGKGERIVLLQDDDAPSVGGPAMDGGADPVLLEHDVAWTEGVAWYSRALTMRSLPAVLGLSTSKITTGS